MINEGVYSFVFKKISCGEGCTFSYIDWKELLLLGIFVCLVIIMFQIKKRRTK